MMLRYVWTIARKVHHRVGTGNSKSYKKGLYSESRQVCLLYKYDELLQNSHMLTLSV